MNPPVQMVTLTADQIREALGDYLNVVFAKPVEIDAFKLKEFTNGAEVTLKALTDKEVLY